MPSSVTLSDIIALSRLEFINAIESIFLTWLLTSNCNFLIILLSPKAPSPISLTVTLSISAGIVKTVGISTPSAKPWIIPLVESNLNIFSALFRLVTLTFLTVLKFKHEKSNEHELKLIKLTNILNILFFS
ncbi:hypothetical protein MGM1_2790 [Candidatus Malacoplasma girerdii]|uniref:Uncharacterized protein n=1 Tax=Candidatus Malacoplasma girerdii TaxID=1318617 RepID=A0A097SST7_9BACT|nr:hypothetical protein MGM1_2790 [Candidatus Malacoplasma girerdii]